MQAVANATMGKYRICDKRYLKMQHRLAGREVLTMVGVGGYCELTPIGTGPNVWVSFEPTRGFVARSVAICGVMDLASEA